MLVLSRYEEESITIGDDVVITVLSVDRNGKVRLGIEAPRDIPVHRMEIYKRVKREQDGRCEDEGGTGSDCCNR